MTAGPARSHAAAFARPTRLEETPSSQQRSCSGRFLFPLSPPPRRACIETERVRILRGEASNAQRQNSRRRPATTSLTRLARTPQMPIRSGPWRSRNARTNTEQPCHPIPSCSATNLTRGIGPALPHTECDGRESCLTSTSCGVQLNAATPCGTSWTTTTLHRVPKPKHPTTLKYVQVPPTGGQEVSPRVFRGCPQVEPREGPPATHKRWWGDAF